MKNPTDQSDTQLQREKSADSLKESSSLWVESHIKIFDPESGDQIVNTRA